MIKQIAPSLEQPQKCLRNLAFFFFVSSSYLSAGGVGADQADMTSVIKSLWHLIKGGQGQHGAGTPKHTFPDTLKGFGYHFSQHGELVNDKGGRFQFEVRQDDPEYNQEHYSALGEVVTEHLYKIMETDLNLERVYVPVDAKKEEPQSFIFRSKDAAQSRKMMVLIQGSGAVRPGQWSRRLIINDNINTGSQLPYIRRAIGDGYRLIVMNPNLNKGMVNGKPKEIRGSESPEQHGVYVWKHFVLPAKAGSIALVAHSYGGIVACAVAEKFMKDFKKRVFSVVFTDSAHTDGRALRSWAVKDFMKWRAVNFVSSDRPLNEKLETSHPDDCRTRSAGTTEHERTSHSCIDRAFEFIRERYVPEEYRQRKEFRSDL